MATEIYLFIIFPCLTTPLFFCIPSIITLVADSHSNMACYDKLTWQNRFIQSKISVLFTTYIGMPIQSLKKCWIQNPCLQWISGFKESNSMDQAYR